MMKTAFTIFALLCAAPASAACYADYKAKQDSPLRLHYGILALSGGCPSGAAIEDAATRRLSAAGWTLLTVLGASPDTPSDQQKATAGDFYLRF